MQATRVDHFAYLPNEIIRDIVAFAADDRSTGFDLSYQGRLATLNGPWSEFAKSSSKVMVRFNGFALQSNDSTDTALNLDEAKTRFISLCVIDKNSDFELIRQVAPNLYETVMIDYSPGVPNTVFDLLGNRFSKVIWRDDGQTTNKTAIEFLKRQLRSKCLRTLSVSSVDLTKDQFNRLLLEFVSKPTFELLCSNCDYILPEVFIEADKAWQAKRHFGVDYQEVNGKFSSKTAKELKEYFDIRPRQTKVEITKEHSIQSSAQKTVKMQMENANLIHFMLEFRNVKREIL